MARFTVEKPTWKELLEREGYVQLPVAHNALTAKLIEQAGFPAYQIGGFALEGAHYGYPDIDLTRFGEKSRAVWDIIESVELPVLVDVDDGYGDAKNVTRTIRTYEAMGVEAIFMEDQKPPKRCGHMAGKVVIPVEQMAYKIEAAVAARQQANGLFLLARTDALQPEGLSAAIQRGHRYLKAGADGIYLEGPTSEKELETIGKEFRGVPLATSILERGGATPWVEAKRLFHMGFTMILYPATVIFRVSHAIQQGLADLKAGKQLSAENSVDMPAFEKLLQIEQWQKIEKRYHGGPESGEG